MSLGQEDEGRFLKKQDCRTRATVSEKVLMSPVLRIILGRLETSVVSRLRKILNTEPRGLYFIQKQWQPLTGSDMSRIITQLTTADILKSDLNLNAVFTACWKVDDEQMTSPPHLCKPQFSFHILTS